MRLDCVSIYLDKKPTTPSAILAENSPKSKHLSIVSSQYTVCLFSIILYGPFSNKCPSNLNKNSMIYSQLLLFLQWLLLALRCVRRFFFFGLLWCERVYVNTFLDTCFCHWLSFTCNVYPQNTASHNITHKQIVLMMNLWL